MPLDVLVSIYLVAHREFNIFYNIFTNYIEKMFWVIDHFGISLGKICNNYQEITRQQKLFKSNNLFVTFTTIYFINFFFLKIKYLLFIPQIHFIVNFEFFL